MKVVARTDEYTIYQKRSERYAVKSSGKGGDRGWVNGDAKVAILLQHKLIEAPAPKAPAAEEAPAADLENAADQAPAADQENAADQEAAADVEAAADETSAEAAADDAAGEVPEGEAPEKAE